MKKGKIQIPTGHIESAIYLGPSRTVKNHVRKTSLKAADVTTSFLASSLKVQACLVIMCNKLLFLT